MTMRKLLLALALTWVGANLVFADGLTETVSNTTTARRTRTVFNDSGSALTSGTVVTWDQGDTEFEDSGYPYVTTTTTVDDIYTAGVMLNGSCPDQTLCEIVVEGPAITRFAQGADAGVVDTLVATSATVGAAGDYTAAANTCSLGTFSKLREAYTGATIGTQPNTATGNNIPMWVNVNISCQ